MKMKTILLGITGISLIWLIASTSYKSYQSRKYVPVDYSSFKVTVGLADGHALYNHMLREDPETGEIILKDVLKARKAVTEFDALKNDAASLSWDHIGPNFVGGRARAILQDNTGTNSNTFYAGSVAGGIFISFNRGELWYEYNSNITSLNISAIAQGPTGTLFVGTGPYFDSYAGYNTNSGFPGDGLFRREFDGNGNHTFKQIVGPAKNSSASSPWRSINRIVANPLDENKIYVATNYGLYYSKNSLDNEVVFTLVPKSLTTNIDDIVISNDGKTVYAALTTGRIRVYRDNGGDDITEIANKSLGFNDIQRTCLAIAPSNDKVLYASCVAVNSCLYSIYQSRDSGETWKVIGPGGTSFDPFINPGVNCQGFYDNAIAVFPDNDGKIIVGGVQLWMWKESPISPGTGGWTQIAVTTGGRRTDTNYVHADKHYILIPNPKEVYIASDGGIGKSIDGGKTWGQINNGFNVTQFYSVDAIVGIPNFFGLGDPINRVIGGSQDNGTQLTGFNDFRPYDAFEITGGDGFDCAISNLSGQAFTTSYYGGLYRVSQSFAQQSSFYDAEISALCASPFTNPCGPFYNRIRYWETPKVSQTFDSVKVYIHETVKTGDTLDYFSSIGIQLPLAFPSYKNLKAGDSIMMPDFIQCKLVVALYSGIYMTRDAAKLATVDFAWDLIAGPNSAPDKFSGTAFAMRFTSDGNQLYIGTQGGDIFRIDNLKYGYDSLTLDTRSNQCVLTCTKIGHFANTSTNTLITSISVDPNNNGNIIITTGGYTNPNDYIYYATGADTVSSPNSVVFLSMQGVGQDALPKIPIYCSLISDHSNKTVVIGTEFGIYATDNAFSAKPIWSVANGGLPKVPVYAIVQQTNKYFYTEETEENKNLHYRKIYIGTHGRGFYVTDDLTGIDEKGNDHVALKDNLAIKVYPNPVSGNLFIIFENKGNERAVIEIMDLNGRLVKTVPNNNPGFTKLPIQTDVSDLTSGTYLVVARTSEEMRVSKFVVIR